MSIQTDLSRIKNAKSAIKAAIEGKGVTVPDATLLDGMAALIEAIEAGGIKLATGEITPASDVNYLEVEHGLGVIPNIAFIVSLSGVFYANSYAACYKKNDLGVGILRSGSNANQIQSYSTTSPITDSSPTSSLMTAFGIAAYAATEEKIRFGNENLTSITVNFKAKKHQWVVGRI